MANNETEQDMENLERSTGVVWIDDGCGSPRLLHGAVGKFNYSGQDPLKPSQDDQAFETSHTVCASDDHHSLVSSQFPSPSSRWTKFRFELRGHHYLSSRVVDTSPISRSRQQSIAAPPSYPCPAIFAYRKRLLIPRVQIRLSLRGSSKSRMINLNPPASAT